MRRMGWSKKLTYPTKRRLTNPKVRVTNNTKMQTVLTSDQSSRNNMQRTFLLQSPSLRSYLLVWRVMRAILLFEGLSSHFVARITLFIAIISHQFNKTISVLVSDKQTNYVSVSFKQTNNIKLLWNEHII